MRLLLFVMLSGCLGSWTHLARTRLGPTAVCTLPYEDNSIRCVANGVLYYCVRDWDGFACAPVWEER